MEEVEIVEKRSRDEREQCYKDAIQELYIDSIIFQSSTRIEIRQ